MPDDPHRRHFGSLRQLPSGRWQARYTGPDGNTYPAGSFGQRRHAERELDRISVHIDERRWTPPVKKVPTATFDAFAREWIANRTVKGRPLKPRTRALYLSILDHDLSPTFGELDPRDVTVAMVRKWHDRTMPPDRPTRRAHAYSLLKTILSDALPAGSANPCQVRGAGTTERKRPIRPATMDEVDAIAAKMPAKYQAAVLLSAWCALRFGEMAELRRRDLDLKTMTLHVERAVTSRANQVVVDTPKSTAGIRKVAIPEHLRDILTAHLDQQARPGRDGLIFPPAGDGSHLAPSTLYKPFRRARTAAGRPDLRWHDLRHSGGMWATEAGASLREVMARMGHSSVGAALRYQHALEERDREITARMGARRGT